MDLRTRFLGLDLRTPIMPGASPLADDLDGVRRLEDAGAPAIVLRSLFEEQIVAEQESTLEALEARPISPEAATWLPTPRELVFGTDAYLEQLRRVKAAVSVPVLSSLNGVTAGGWLEHARLMEQAGADARELNVYDLAVDPAETSEVVEQRVKDIVVRVKASVRIPVAVKLSPFFSSIPHLAVELERAGADGLVVFNRFYQPDIDPVLLEAVPRLHLSDPSELLLRLRWLAILRPRVALSLAATGGVHSGQDAVKAVMAGADAVQVTSVLLRHGPMYLRILENQLRAFMDQNEYESIGQMKGSMSHAHCPDPRAFERANYMRVLQSWRG